VEGQSQPFVANLGVRHRATDLPCAMPTCRPVERPGWLDLACMCGLSLLTFHRQEHRGPFLMACFYFVCHLSLISRPVRSRCYRSSVDTESYPLIISIYSFVTLALCNPMF